MEKWHPIERWLELKFDEVILKLGTDKISTEEMLVLVIKEQNEIIKELLKKSQTS